MSQLSSSHGHGTGQLHHEEVAVGGAHRTAPALVSDEGVAGQGHGCQNTKKNHIMSVVLVRPYIADRKSRRLG